MKEKISKGWEMGLSYLKQFKFILAILASMAVGGGGMKGIQYMLSGDEPKASHSVPTDSCKIELQALHDDFVRLAATQENQAKGIENLGTQYSNLVQRIDRLADGRMTFRNGR